MAEPTAETAPIWFQRLDDRRALGALLGASLLLKCALLPLLEPVSADSALYITAAHAFLQGHFRDAVAVYPLPLYPLLLALCRLLLPNWELAAVPTTLGASVITLVPIYRLTRDLFDAKAAFWAALAFTLSPYLNHYGLYIIRDPAALAAFAWALYFAHRFLAAESLVPLVAAFACTTAAAGLRAETMFFLAIYPLFLLVSAGLRRDDRSRRRRRAAAIWVALLLGLTTVIVLSLPDLWLYVTQGEYFRDRLRGLVSAVSLENYRALNRALKEFQSSSKVFDPGGHNLISLVRAYMPLIYVLGVLESFFRMLYPLYGIGLIYGLKQRITVERGLVLCTGLFFSVSAYLFLLTENWLSKRYLSLTVLCFLPWVGIGWAELLDRLQAPRRRIVRAAALVVLVLLPLIQTIQKNSEPHDPTLRTAGTWLGTQPELKTARLYSSDNRILLHATHFADIPRWGDDKTLRMKQLTSRSQDEMVAIDPNDSGLGAFDWNRLVPIKTFAGANFKVDIYGPPELAARLRDR